MDVLTQDLRHALRLLVRRPGWTTAAVLTLALGIGASTTIYSVVHAVLVRPLPYPDAERLVRLRQVEVESGEGLEVATFDGYEAWRDRQRVLTPFGAYAGRTVTLATAAGAERVAAAYLSAGALDALRATPVLGRPLVAADDREGAAPVVLLAHGTWRTRYGSDPRVVGSTLELEGVRRTVVGVLPPGFDFPAPGTEFWLPLATAPRDPGTAYLSLLGRVPPGTSMGRAEAGLAREVRVEAGETGSDPARHRLIMEPLRASVVGDVGPLLLVFLGAVALLLLVATLNVANLVLVRAAERERELDLRAALGAGRRRLVRLHVTEGLVLAGASAALGVVAAAWLVGAFRRLDPSVLPRAAEVGLHPGVLWFSVGLTILVGVGVGLAPALRSRGRGLGARLRSGGDAVVGGGAGVRRGLVVAQVALATVLLAAGGLLGRSMAELWRTDAGFRTERVASIGAVLPSTGYEDADRRSALYRALAERLESRPEIRSVGLASFLPFTPGRSVYDLVIDGRPEPGPGQPGPTAEVLLVGGSYFETLGVPVLEGRTFQSAGDDASTGTPAGAVISETLARRHWPDGGAVGTRIRLEDETWWTVLGVVGDTRQHGLHAPPAGQVYLPYDRAFGRWPFGLAVLVRPTGGLGPAATAARGVLADLDPTIAFSGARWLDPRAGAAVAASGLRVRVIGAFALLALVLATVGVYGVTAYAAAVRRREMGLRIALGATRAEIVSSVLRDGGLLVAAGLGLGLVGSLAAGRLLERYLVGVGPRDPLTLGVIATLLAGVALLAAYLPARRLSRLDPASALRPD